MRYHKGMTHAEELAKIFFEFSYIDEMQGVPFKPRAYQLASESMTALKDEVEAAWHAGGIKALKELPGVGERIAEKIDEYFRTGHVKEYDQLKKKYPIDIWDMAQIEGLGPKHILELYKRLHVRTLEDLTKALETHSVRTIPRWGAKSEEKLTRGLGLMKSSSGRHLLGKILPIADEIVAALKGVQGVKRCTVAGSIRRRQETIGDIDIIATSSDPKRVMDAFTKLPHVETVHEKGTTRSSVRLTIGIDADLRVVPDAVYGATLQYFTGDKRHNVLLREYALSKGFTLNEYGLFRLKRTRDGHQAGALLVCKTEDAIYRHLGMETPPPEIRVGADEIDAAREHRLPDLIPYGSVKGDLQTQTDWTDGSSSIETMALAAKAAGLSYIAITDHTSSLAFINGLDAKRLAEQRHEIERLNKRLRGFRILAGTECNVAKNGTLDLPDSALVTLDWVGIAVHSNLKLTRAEQTKRIIKALSNPNVDCLFHPTCRIIGKREPIDVDIDEIIAAAKKYRVALEIDAFPDRSDLRDTHVRAAIKAGVTLVINTDAHDPRHYAYLPLGEAIARRGWATTADVLNTRNVKQLETWLSKKRTRRFAK
jgi:DNA polymerase (family 10)